MGAVKCPLSFNSGRLIPGKQSHISAGISITNITKRCIFDLSWHSKHHNVKPQKTYHQVHTTSISGMMSIVGNTTQPKPQHSILQRSLHITKNKEFGASIDGLGMDFLMIISLIVPAGGGQVLGGIHGQRSVVCSQIHTCIRKTACIVLRLLACC